MKNIAKGREEKKEYWEDVSLMVTMMYSEDVSSKQTDKGLKDSKKYETKEG